MSLPSPLSAELAAQLLHEAASKDAVKTVWEAVLSQNLSVERMYHLSREFAKKESQLGIINLAPSVMHVADKTARYNLPLSTAPGTVVIQDDAGIYWRLKAPSTAIGGYYVSGGAQDGIYSNSEDGFILGTDPNGDTDNAASLSTGNADDGRYWAFRNQGDVIYYSTDNVATPDLCTHWFNSSDDSPVSLSVVPVTQGELDAGCTISGAGYTPANGIQVRVADYDDDSLGCPSYGDESLQGAAGTNWSIDSGRDVGGPIRSYNAPIAAFPWETQFLTGSGGRAGVAPAPIVTRNDVATPANWEIVNP